ncbi:MAG: hypothetical protein P8125_12135 [Gemmatimonadota bacterium]|jgi:hypothetical protein
MSRRIVLTLLVPLVAVATMRPAFAQQGVTELGFDMALAYETESESFSVSLPIGGVLNSLLAPPGGLRAGFFLSDVTSLEPSLSVAYLALNGSDNPLAISSALKLLYHLSSDPDRTRAYIGVGPSFLYVKDGEQDSSQFGVLGELGLKIPIAQRVGTRMAAGFMHGFDSDDFSERNMIYLTAGLSVFLGGD